MWGASSAVLARPWLRLMVGGDTAAVALRWCWKRWHLDGTAEAHGRSRGDGPTSTVKMGGSTCCSSGAGQIVKMVHNGIEIWRHRRAYPEGLNILHLHRRRLEAPTSRRRNDAHCATRRPYSTSSTQGDHRAVAARQRRVVVVARPHGACAAGSSRSSRTSRTRSDSGEGRWTTSPPSTQRRRARAERRAVAALRVARAGRLRRQGAVSHALRVRRPPRETCIARRPSSNGAGERAEGSMRWSSFRRHRRPRYIADLSRSSQAMVAAGDPKVPVIGVARRVGPRLAQGAAWQQPGAQQGGHPRGRLREPAQLAPLRRRGLRRQATFTELRRQLGKTKSGPSTTWPSHRRSSALVIGSSPPAAAPTAAGW